MHGNKYNHMHCCAEGLALQCLSFQYELNGTAVCGETKSAITLAGVFSTLLASGTVSPQYVVEVPSNLTFKRLIRSM